MNAPLIATLLILWPQQAERIPLEAAPDQELAGLRVPPDGYELALYDVAHLTSTHKAEDVAAQLSVEAGKPVTTRVLDSLKEYEMLRKRAEGSIESIRLAVRDAMRPAFDESTNRAVTIGDDSLAIVASSAQQASVRRFLEHAARFEGLVDVQARLVFLEPGGLQELGRGRSGEVMDEAATKALLAALERRGVETVTAPRLTAFPFQRAELSILDRQAYIADYGLRIVPAHGSEGPAEVADPVVAHAESGVRMNLRCVPLSNGKLALEARIEHTDVVQPIPTQKIKLGAQGHPVTIQIPETKRIKLEGRFEMLPGQTLVMATTDPGGEREVMMLVRADLGTPGGEGR